MISLVVNLDTRPGLHAPLARVGDDGAGSLHGCRHVDFLTHGVRNQINFFAGHRRLQVIVYIDEHEPLPPAARAELTAMYQRHEIAHLVCKPHDRQRRRWYDHIYLDALELATGNYVAHFDQDCHALRAPGVDPVAEAVRALNRGDCDFVCQPSQLEAHGMWWASTRFFLSRTLNVPELRRCLDDNFLRKKLTDQPPFYRCLMPCCLEQTLGVLAGPGRVWYPPADWNRYLVWSWAHYPAGVLEWLNQASYAEAHDYLVHRCGIHGANDVVGKPLKP